MMRNRMPAAVRRGTRRTGLPQARATSLALLATSALVLAGCTAAPSPGQEAVQGFQTRVLEVTESAAGQDYRAALDELATLTAEVEDALERKEITAEKRDAIVSAIQAVIAQLNAALAPATPDEGTDGSAPEPEPEPSSGDGEEPEETETPAPEATPSVAPSAPQPTTSPTTPPSSTPTPTPEPDPEPDPDPSPTEPADTTGGPGTGNGGNNGNGNGNGNDD
jgi:outer membrane biosynthesis protein TonB